MSRWRALLNAGWVLAASLCPTTALALEVSARGDILLYGDYRLLNQNGFSALDSSKDGYLVAGANLLMQEKRLTLELRPEIRALSGDAASTQPSDAAYLSVQAPPRWISLERRIGSSSDQGFDYKAFVDLERFTASYSSDSFELGAGRKPFSPGVLKIFPVWNKFSKPLTTTPGLGFVFGQDQAWSQLQEGGFILRAHYLKGAQPSDDVSWLEGIWMPENCEVHLMGARWWDHRVGGLAVAFDFQGLTLRTEDLWISDLGMQLAVGAERAFGRDWSVQLEGLYLQDGSQQIRTTQDDIKLPNRFVPLPSAYYGALQVTFQATQLLALTTGGLLDGVDGSFYSVSRINYSLAQSLEIFTDAKLPLGTQGTRFSTRTLTLPDQRYIGAPTQFGLGVRIFL